MADPDKRPIDLTRRTLVRIFAEGQFDKGGRFYRGWWQNVPSSTAGLWPLRAKGPVNTTTLS